MLPDQATAPVPLPQSELALQTSPVESSRPHNGMATGLPVVATSIFGIPELVIDDQTGMLVKDGDVQELASAIVRLCKEPELGIRLAQRARSLVVERFNNDVESDRVATFFEAAMNDETTSALGAERSHLDRVGILSK